MASGETAAIPAGILSDNRLRPQAKLLYGLLERRASPFTYKTLSEAVNLSLVTVRQTVRELAETGWLAVKQAHQLAPITFSLLNPGQAEVAEADRRLQDADYKGEALMKEYLSLLIDSDRFEDNARPGFLINPLTGEPMELDRYYPEGAGFEHNGRQHYETTSLQPSENRLRMQRARDLMKEALCARNGIKLVVIHQADLTLESMQQKVGALLPLRDLRGHEALIAYLEQVSQANRT
ncbi:MAG TPA: ArsR family transcriptional regulator [Symbiobacteriaceae bacterium]|jgi:predicted transcriptional regulator|nr:ArsR family transcriptional regulator [Symbiobacteriaceae bacterium]